jgi:hypothetical protein
VSLVRVLYSQETKLTGDAGESKHWTGRRVGSRPNLSMNRGQFRIAKKNFVQPLVVPQLNFAVQLWK